MKFSKRTQAGELLAEALQQYRNRSDVIVLGLPRGGVLVAHEIAKALNAPLDVFVVRKLGAPGQGELAMGAIASGGVQVLNEDVIEHLGATQEEIDQVLQIEMLELARRERLYRGGRPMPDLVGKIVILADDGLATGSTMRAALRAVRQLGPARVVVAVPVAAMDAYTEFRAVADEVVCLSTPEPFESVGNWYDDFTQTTDDEVRALLKS